MLKAEYGDVGENALLSLKLKDGSKLLAENVRQVLTLAAAAKTQYAKFEIPENHATQLGLCTDASRCDTGPLPESKRADDPTAPGVRVDFKMADGSVVHGRFKAEVQSVPPAFVGNTGIPADKPQFGLRCIASSLLDKCLGLDVIAPVAFGIVDGKPGVVELGRGCPPMIKDYEAGSGTSASSTRGPMTGDVRVSFNHDDPFLLKKVNDLQWFDALCGQVGRGSEGYLIEQKDDGRFVNVMGVQNGLSFGKSLTAPKDGFPELVNDLADKGEKRFSNLKLPSIISKETADAFEKLSDKAIQDTLAGLLSEEEIAACVKRLGAITKRLKEEDGPGKLAVARILSNQARDDLVSLNEADMRQRQVLEEPETWNTEHVSVFDWSKSQAWCYVARDRSDLKSLRGVPVINYRDVKF